VAGRETRRLDLRGSAASTPLPSSFAFRLGILSYALGACLCSK
jgi:hypothetical protein